MGEAFGDRDRIDVDLHGDGHAVATLEIPHHALDDTRLGLVRTADGWRIERVLPQMTAARSAIAGRTAGIVTSTVVPRPGAEATMS